MPASARRGHEAQVHQLRRVRLRRPGQQQHRPRLAALAQQEPPRRVELAAAGLVPGHHVVHVTQAVQPGAVEAVAVALDDGRHERVVGLGGVGDPVEPVRQRRGGRGTPQVGLQVQQFGHLAERAGEVELGGGVVGGIEQGLGQQHAPLGEVVAHRVEQRRGRVLAGVGGAEPLAGGASRSIVRPGLTIGSNAHATRPPRSASQRSLRSIPRWTENWRKSTTAASSANRPPVLKISRKAGWICSRVAGWHRTGAAGPRGEAPSARRKKFDSVPTELKISVSDDLRKRRGL